MTQVGRKRKRTTAKKMAGRRRKKSFTAKFSKKIQPKNTAFHTATFSPVSFRR
jgi:hypothetical protein